VIFSCARSHASNGACEDPGPTPTSSCERSRTSIKESFASVPWNPCSKKKLPQPQPSRGRRRSSDRATDV